MIDLKSSFWRGERIAGLHLTDLKLSGLVRDWDVIPLRPIHGVGDLTDKLIGFISSFQSYVKSLSFDFNELSEKTLSRQTYIDVHGLRLLTNFTALNCFMKLLYDVIKFN